MECSTISSLKSSLVYGNRAFASIDSSKSKIRIRISTRIIPVPTCYIYIIWCYTNCIPVRNIYFLNCISTFRHAIPDYLIIRRTCSSYRIIRYTIFKQLKRCCKASAFKTSFFKKNIMMTVSKSEHFQYISICINYLYNIICSCIIYRITTINKTSIFISSYMYIINKRTVCS